ncbi:MAG: polysaccharide biosynthesis C-terminal domain-containing protein, partial [Clostridia bacterium]|nr:polysaccharide biosynthesis C-terminal domain-containing protein [Clostridia bacterium]
VSFLFMERLYKKKLRLTVMPSELSKDEFKSRAIKILKTALPITLVGIMIPFSQLLDSFIIVNKLFYIDNPTKLYGLFSGVAITVVNLPVSVCYGIAVASLPKISGSKDVIEKKNNIIYSITLTLLITVPAIFICYYFSPFIIKILFNSLNQQDKSIAIRLIKIISPSIALLSLLQTTNSILIAKNRLYFPLFSMAFGIIVKTIMQIVLMSKININIYGGGFALIACYFVAVLINLIAIVLFRDKNENREIKVKQQNIK